ncbi:MAG: hypothetical protein NVSMB64_01560 [Candidatus Velthaea sp.]
MRRARAALRDTAVERVAEIEAAGAQPNAIHAVRERYERSSADGAAYRAVQIDVLERQRDALVALHDAGRIDNHAMRAVQSTLDLELVQLRASDEGAGMEDEAGSLSS